MREFEKRFSSLDKSTCHFIDKPVAVIQCNGEALKKAEIFLNGPAQKCEVTRAMCALARRNFAPDSECAHVYATSKIEEAAKNFPAVLAMKYFPNIIEHRDIINLACEGKLKALYFYEPSWDKNGPCSQEGS